MRGSTRQDTGGGPGIRRLALAWFLSLFSTFALSVAVLVYAYDQGGAPLVAFFGIASTAPGAVTTPLLMSLAGRTRGDRVLLFTTAGRTAFLAAAGLAAIADLPPAVVVALAALGTALGSTFRPTQAALLPWLARTPKELTAANVSATVAENAAALAGPVLAGALLLWSDATTAMLVAAVLMGLATAALASLDAPRGNREAQGPLTFAGLLRDVGTGSAALVKVAPPAGFVIIALLQTFVRGALVVLLVVLALDTLQLGESSIGWLNAAIGLGGLLGAVVGSRAVRLTRLGRCFLAGVLLWGVGVLLLAGATGWAMALGALLLVGMGNALEDASAFTLLPRLLGTRVAGPALGAFELVILAGLGAGALAAPALAADLGVRGALAVCGGVLCLVPFLYAVTFTRVDRAVPQPPPAAEMLHSLPTFDALPVVVVEELASALQENRFAPGTTVVAEGAPGDRYHLVTAGSAAVHVHGVARRTLGPGDGFGEIALLRDIPRTATVTAVSDLTTLSLERSAFLDAVSTSRLSRHHADAVADRRLAEDAGQTAPA